MESGCHEWQGHVAKKTGYGQTMGDDQKVIYAHRAAWLLAQSDPGESFVLHKCDNRRCVNPEHLFLGTFQDNMTDMKNKGRAAWGTKQPHAKLTAEKVKEIRASKLGTVALARHYGMAPSSISLIKTGKNWARI
jgi:hypothetical protein